MLWVQALQAASTHYAGLGGSTAVDVEELADRWFRRAVQVGAKRA